MYLCCWVKARTDPFRPQAVDQLEHADEVVLAGPQGDDQHRLGLVGRHLVEIWVEGIGHVSLEGVGVRDEERLARRRDVARQGGLVYRDLAVGVDVLVREEIVAEKRIVLHVAEFELSVLDEEYGTRVGGREGARLEKDAVEEGREVANMMQLLELDEDIVELPGVRALAPAILPLSLPVALCGAAFLFCRRVGTVPDPSAGPGAGRFRPPAGAARYLRMSAMMPNTWLSGESATLNRASATSSALRAPPCPHPRRLLRQEHGEVEIEGSERHIVGAFGDIAIEKLLSLRIVAGGNQDEIEGTHYVGVGAVEAGRGRLPPRPRAALSPVCTAIIWRRMPEVGEPG